MDFYFIFVQLIGLVAWFILVLSYYRKNTNKILVFHIIATILYAIHYLLLNAYSGLFISVLTIIINYGYYKTNKDKYIFLASIPFYFLIAFFSYGNFIDLLPIYASIVDSYVLTKKKDVVLKGSVISYGLWIIYDFTVKSYSGVITDCLLVISNIFILRHSKDMKKVIKKIKRFT